MIPGARLRPLVGADPDDVQATLRAMLERLERHKIPATVRLRFEGEHDATGWTLDSRTRELQEGIGARCDLEVRPSPETWLAIAMGRLAPLDALAQGKLAVRGDTRLATHLYERLKDETTGGITSPCR